MTTPTMDVAGIGNAIVDVIAHADDDFLVQTNAGHFDLIDGRRSGPQLAFDGCPYIIFAQPRQDAAQSLGAFVWTVDSGSTRSRIIDRSFASTTCSSLPATR